MVFFMPYFVRALHFKYLDIILLLHAVVAESGDGNKNCELKTGEFNLLRSMYKVKISYTQISFYQSNSGDTILLCFILIKINKHKRPPTHFAQTQPTTQYKQKHQHQHQVAQIVISQICQVVAQNLGGQSLLPQNLG